MQKSWKKICANCRIDLTSKYINFSLFGVASLIGDSQFGSQSYSRATVFMGYFKSLSNAGYLKWGDCVGEIYYYSALICFCLDTWITVLDLNVFPSKTFFSVSSNMLKAMNQLEGFQSQRLDLQMLAMVPTLLVMLRWTRQNQEAGSHFILQTLNH